MGTEHPTRKHPRLKEYDYGQDGAYFITFCTQHKRCLLSRVVGAGAFDGPRVELTPYGKITEKYILSGNGVGGVFVDRYVIMPNHVHMILNVQDAGNGGPSRAPAPTNQKIPHFISTLKRFCHREMGGTDFPTLLLRPRDPL